MNKHIFEGLPKNKDLILDYHSESGGIGISERPSNPKNAFAKAIDGEIREYPIQLYFKEFHKDYGFKNIQGPFRVGPDFTTYEKIGIEVERDWKSYINHGHHQNPAFDSAKYLVVLTPGEPPEAKLELLPEKIIFLDIESFVSWYRNTAKEYYENEWGQQQLTFRIELVANELRRRYLDVCPDQEREMAICPDCRNCAYEPEINFSDWALEHIIRMDYPIWDDKFSLSNIDVRKLDEFFKQSMLNAY